jgi:hypothetical protein
MRVQQMLAAPRGAIGEQREGAAVVRGEVYGSEASSMASPAVAAWPRRPAPGASADRMIAERLDLWRHAAGPDGCLGKEADCLVEVGESYIR